MPIDPVTGDWYDDEEEYSDFMFPGAQNPWLDPMAPLSMGYDFNKYGEMEPYEQADMNQQLTGMKNIMALLGNPMMNYVNMVMNGADTFDMDAFGAGAGAGGGGYGGGGGTGAVAPVPTPYSDAMGMSGDPVEQGIYDAIVNGGQTPASYMAQLAGTDLTPEDLDAYGQAAEKLFMEQSNVRQQALQPAPQSEMEQWLAKTGLPDPRALYGVGDTPLPADIDVGGREGSAMAMIGYGNEQANRYLKGATDEEKEVRKPVGLTPTGALGGALDRAVDFVGDAGRAYRAEKDAADNGELGFFRNIAQQAPAGFDRSYFERPKPIPGIGEVLADAVNGPNYEDYYTPGEGVRSTPESNRATAQARFLKNAQGRLRDERAQENRFMVRGPDGKSRAMNAGGAAANARQRAHAIAEADKSSFNSIVAQELQKRGRTPARDRMQQQIAMMRSMGLGI